jgi:hypothetical protein
VPVSHVTIHSQAIRLSQATSTTNQILDLIESCDPNLNFLVLGSIGTKGPQPAQLGSHTFIFNSPMVSTIHVQLYMVGSTALSALKLCPTPVIVVPPTPQSFINQRSHLYVLAMDCSDTGKVCFHTVLQLLKPHDRLHILHIRAPPGLLENESSVDAFLSTHVALYEAKMATAQAHTQRLLIFSFHLIVLDSDELFCNRFWEKWSFYEGIKDARLPSTFRTTLTTWLHPT